MEALTFLADYHKVSVGGLGWVVCASLHINPLTDANLGHAVPVCALPLQVLT